MSQSRPLIRSILKGKRRGNGQPAPASDELTDDVRLLEEISLQVEREKFSGGFDARHPGEHKASLQAKMDDLRAGRRKKPAPKHNRALREAERAALQKRMTPGRYRQMMKEHLEILPLVYKKMDNNAPL
ncbi:MAG: hypothetical protein A4E28_02741 [Methanocella sp. PtaU1.Bin125]|nr:MAG: hypothetical protein A4E28_02741 [Methanocella sp. PtaU1.Bin125]